jgi:hypothetical protein
MMHIYPCAHVTSIHTTATTGTTTTPSAINNHVPEHYNLRKASLRCRYYPVYVVYSSLLPLSMPLLRELLPPLITSARAAVLMRPCEQFLCCFLSALCSGTSLVRLVDASEAYADKVWVTRHDIIALPVALIPRVAVLQRPLHTRYSPACAFFWL